jgi:PAS domain S-box-containing protein
VNKQIQFAIAALVLSLGLAIYGIIVFANAEKGRDLQALQTQMSLVADSRVEALDHWLQAQYAVLEGLARNESLHRHVKATIQDSAGSANESRDALRALLAATAARAGFVSYQATGYQPAYSDTLVDGGLAVLDAQGGVLVATSEMSPIETRLTDFLAQTPLEARALLDLHRGAHERPTLGFLVPVLEQPDGQDGTSAVLARILALRPVDAGFFAMLRQSGVTARTAESYLIRRSDNLIEYLSPLLDASEPLTKRLAINTEQLIDVEALSQPGLFHQGRDYAFKDSFAVSRSVPGTDWVLVYRIGAAEALAASDARRMALISGLAVLAVLIGAALVLVWLYATSRRVEEVAECYRLSSERFERLSGFLDILTDSQPNPILVVDADNHITYANRRLAELSGFARDELIGRSLAGVLGQDTGTLYNAINQRVLETGTPQVEIGRILDDRGQEHIWRSHHTAFAAATEAQEPAVLVTIEDLTDLMHERARRERNTQHLLDTLVGLVDERDPDSAHQSRYVVQVARAIAEDLGFERSLIETTEQAARLVNIGKIRIPRSLLVKGGGLTDQELKRVREALDEGPDLLRDIEFDGPVLDTLSQINEWVDGSGRPRGLKDDAILPTAQVVALANAFVALISPRAFRDAKSFDEAEAILMREIGRRFDKRFVLSLLNHLDNRGGRAEWTEMSRRG